MIRLIVFAIPVCALALSCSSSDPLPLQGGVGASGHGGGATTTTSGGGHGSPVNVAPLKIHVLSATLEMLDAASIYTDTQIEGFITASNTAFEPTGIAWQIAEISIQDALDEASVSESVETGTPKGGVALANNIDHDALLAPNGWDAIVVRKTAPLGFGGVYKCSLDASTNTPGAIFVPLLAGNGQTQATRKWAHELGHMMNLPHTPCTAEYADNLMMSGNCELADPDRVKLTAEQITAVQAQYAQGGPATCGN